SKVIGLVAPVADIFSLAKKYHAYTLVDMSQTAGLVDLDIQNAACDFAVFAGHKTLYGPTGISGFFMKPDILLPPVLFGGTGIASAEQDMPKDLPARYEMGTMNISGIAGLHAALGWLLATGIDKIRKREDANRQQLLKLLGEYDFLQIVGVNSEREYVGVVSVLFDGISSDSAGPLFDERGIAVRTGLQCAPLAHKFLGTFPAGTIRFSVSYFTTEADFEALRDVLDEIEEEL
uniref:aminotransferase class V-fold PLP-dependent enzyme n=1 Tax=Mitsuokella sp. TaxID=2049034 RepID=UPI003D7EC69A